MAEGDIPGNIKYLSPATAASDLVDSRLYCDAPITGIAADTTQVARCTHTHIKLTANLTSKHRYLNASKR